MKRVFQACVLVMLIAEVVLWQAGLQLWGLLAGLQLFFIGFNVMEALLPSVRADASTPSLTVSFPVPSGLLRGRPAPQKLRNMAALAPDMRGSATCRQSTRLTGQSGRSPDARPARPLTPCNRLMPHEACHALFISRRGRFRPGRRRI